MAYQSRTPSSKLTLDNSLFNNLVSILDFNAKANIESENFSIVAARLKDKLLTYSVPREDEDGEYIDVRFFPNEASDMIWQLLIQAKTRDDVEDYCSILKANREEKKNS